MAEECKFLIESLVTQLPIPEIKKHLQKCGQCRQELEDWFRMYKAYRGRPGGKLFPDLPPHIRHRDEFLIALIVRHAMDNEQTEHDTALWQEALRDAETLYTLQNLITDWHRLLYYLTVVKSKLLVEQTVTSLLAHYRKLAGTLRASAFVLAMGLKGYNAQQPLTYLADLYQRLIALVSDLPYKK